MKYKVLEHKYNNTNHYFMLDKRFIGSSSSSWKHNTLEGAILTSNPYNPLQFVVVDVAGPLVKCVPINLKGAYIPTEFIVVGNIVGEYSSTSHYTELLDIVKEFNKL